MQALDEDTDPDLLIEYVDIGDVDSLSGIQSMSTLRFGDAPSRARRVVKDGDVIISTVRTYLQAIAPIQGTPDNLIVSTGFAVIRPKPGKLDAGYCKYALRDPEFLSEVMMRSVGASYPAINASELVSIPVFVPPVVQQRRIASYLDAETARLDELFAAKQRLLVLLGEKRSALITQTVTCGLDPALPMRDSGVPWLGEIPAHWEVVNLKFLADVRTGLAKGRELDKSRAVLMPYLRVANVQDGYVDLSDIAEIEVLPEEIAGYRLLPGDVLMNEGGDADKLGRGAVWSGEIDPCLHQNHVFAVRCHSVDPMWLSTVTSSEYAKAYFESHAKQSTNLASISATNLKELPVVLPPPIERVQLHRQLDTQLASLDNLNRATQQTIQLLQERRAALISACVTGQVDVMEQSCN